MPDNIVFPVFLALSLLSLSVGTFAGYFAFKNSHKIETEMSMVFWAIVSLGCVVFGGLIWGWFLIPIIMNHL
ncbi:MAG: hypothetical protein WCX28_08420 [Bacteriovoracaceae bacterium]|nr:hypothetical protein [Bacteroidota bacterium]